MKICNDCGKELLDDSIFCQYCGSKNIKERLGDGTTNKFCNSCNKNVPNDSIFCPYCGNKNIADLSVLEPQEEKVVNDIRESKKSHIPTQVVVIALIICISILLCYSVNRDQSSNGQDLNDNLANEYALTYTHKDNALYNNLESYEKQIYDALFEKSMEILEEGDTNITIKMPSDFKLNYYLFYNLDTSNTINAFQCDYPYLAFWLYEYEDLYLEGYESDSGYFYDINVHIKPVSYYRNTASSNQLSTTLVNKANEAYQNAVSIADTSFENDKDALIYFKDYIRESSIYEDSVVEDITNGNFNHDTGMASNFINVFDEYDSTNVVCSGYSSAYLLLCDLYGIDDCYYIGGYMDDIGHAWNIYIEDGIRYLIDVTNTDDYDNLFLVEIPYSTEYNVETTYGPILYIEDSYVSNAYNFEY